MEYHGRLNSVDSYMNVKLTNTEEWKDGKNEGTLGEVFIRYLTLFSQPQNCFEWLLTAGAIMCSGLVRMRLMILIGCSRIETQIWREMEGY